MFLFLTMIGDPEGNKKLERLYHKHRGKIYYWSNNIVHDNYLAEDVVQSVFLALTQKGTLDKINEDDIARTLSYLAVITKNIAINYYNNQKKETIMPMDAESEEILFNQLSSNDIDEFYENLELKDTINTIKTLSEKYSSIMVLKYVEEYSDKEIAGILKIKEATVRKRLERAKLKLRKEYEKRYPFLRNEFLEERDT